MAFKNFLYYSLNAVTCLSSQLTMLVIREYHKNKPLGMQTILTKVTILVTKVFAAVISTIISNACIAELIGPFSRSMSIFSTILDYVCVIVFYSTVTMSVLTKYALIYHGPRFAGVSERIVTRVFAFLCCILAPIMTFFEYGYFSTFDNLGLFQQRLLGYSKPNAQLELGISGSIFVTMLAFLFLQIRIEIDAFKADSDFNKGLIVRIAKAIRSRSNTAADTDTGTFFGYNVSVLRTGMVIVLAGCLIIVYQLSGGEQNTKWNQATFLFVLSAVLPTIFIWKHDGMKTVAKKMFKNVIAFKDSVYITSF